MSNTSLPVLVAGGGIGGLASALALVRQGFTVQVFEQASEIGEIGAGIQLGPNAFHAFDALGVGDVGEEAQRHEVRKQTIAQLLGETGRGNLPNTETGVLWMQFHQVLFDDQNATRRQLLVIFLIGIL